MRIRKVKITKFRQIHMIYEDGRGNRDEYSFTCMDPARPEFYQALEALNVFVLDMCELPENYLDRITVKGVSYSWGGENNTMGAVISAAMTLNESYQPLNLITPHKVSEMYCPDTPDDEKQLLSGDCVEALKKLIAECELYIKGDRAQGSLFPEVRAEDATGATAQQQPLN